MPEDTADRTISDYVATTTGIIVLPTDDGRSIPAAALADVEFARSVPMPWTRCAGDTYGLLAAIRTDLEDRS